MGNLHVIDTGNNVTRVVNPWGVVTTLVGNTNAYGEQNGWGPTATLNTPFGIEITDSGHLLIAEGGGNDVRKVI